MRVKNMSHDEFDDEIEDLALEDDDE